MLVYAREELVHGQQRHSSSDKQVNGARSVDFSILGLLYRLLRYTAVVRIPSAAPLLGTFPSVAQDIRCWEEYQRPTPTSFSLML
jgi:hypothetical protein